MATRRANRDEKRQKTVKIIIGLFVVIIMVMSAAQLAVNNQQFNEQDYNGHSFELDTQTRTYLLDFEGRTYNFYTWPGYNDDINITPGAGPLLRDAKAILYTFDPEGTNLQAIEQVIFELDSLIEVGSNKGVIRNNSVYAALPILSCSDAQQYAPVVYFRESNKTTIETSGNCIIVNANNTEVYRMRDMLLLMHLGIVEG